MITKRKSLWKQAFGDSDAFLDIFFSVAYAPERSQVITVKDDLAAALYWFDCTCRGKKLAYIYAVATDENYQNQGLCRRLMAQTHEILRQQGYVGAILVPGSQSLFDMYGKMGYGVCSFVTETISKPGNPVALQQIDKLSYAALRLQYMPSGGVIQEGATLTLLEKTANFYAGENFVFASYCEEGKLHVHELLGAGDLSGITAALGAEEGFFRMVGNSKPFAMYCGFTEDPAPVWFGLALD